MSRSPAGLWGCLGGWCLVSGGPGFLGGDRDELQMHVLARASKSLRPSLVPLGLQVLRPPSSRAPILSHILPAPGFTFTAPFVHSFTKRLRSSDISLRFLLLPDPDQPVLPYYISGVSSLPHGNSTTPSSASVLSSLAAPGVTPARVGLPPNRPKTTARHPKTVIY